MGQQLKRLNERGETGRDRGERETRNTGSVDWPGGKDSEGVREGRRERPEDID